MSATLGPKRRDPDFVNYLLAGIAAGSTMSESNRDAVNAFFVGIKSDAGVSTMANHPIKASCLLCAWDTLAGALTPLVGAAPTNNGFLESDYSKKLGLLGDGISKYINSNRANDADTQDNQAMGVWLSEIGTAPNYVIGGGRTQAGSSLVGQGLTRSHCAATEVATLATGINAISRSAGASYARRIGSTNSTALDASDGVTTGPIFVFTRGSTIGDLPNTVFSNAKIPFYFISESLDLALLDARLATLMSSLT